MGFSAYFLVVWDLVPLRRGRAASASGPGGGARRARASPTACASSTSTRSVRPAVRAVPQPGPQADARHRHGLRLALPRRDDPVRGGALRRRPRRADRHLLHDQGAGRGARRRARARLPVRRRRQDRQAHAAADHGPRHAAARVLRAGRRVTRTATRWRPSCARSTRPIPTPSACIDVARGLEGLRRQDGIHAAAVVITREPLTEYLPIQRKPEPAASSRTRRSSPSTRCTASRSSGSSRWTSSACATSTCIEIALELIERIDRARAPTSTASRSTTRTTFEMLRRGDTIGVFQLEGGPMRALLRSLAPTTFEDVAALVALYRPGPDGAELAQRVRRPQERPQAGRPTRTPTSRRSSRPPTG